MSEQAVEYLREDPHLGPVVEKHGPVSIEAADDLFERMVVSIIRQQVSMQSAAAIRERLFDCYDVTSATIADADPDALRDVGLSEAKTTYVQSAADAFQTKSYDRAYFQDMSNEEVMEELTSIDGVGPWTARMQLMFGLGRPDIFPVEDLGIRKGMHALFHDNLTRNDMRDLAADHWQPYRSYASLYVWRAYEG